MTFKRIFLSTIILTLFFAIELQAQRKVLGAPVNFDSPIDYFPEDRGGSYDNYRTYLDRTSPKNRKEGWLVFSDRSNNEVYNKPGGSKSGMKLGFLEDFYVVEEQGEWIKIVDCTVNGIKIVNKERDIGWVKKENMLLWNKGIIDPKTRINKKVLLLHKIEEVERILKGDREIVNVYQAPDGLEKVEPRKIMEYFFVLKKENGRILISTDAIIGFFNKDAAVVGWVDERDCTPWNSRVCLEPNFNENAFKERAAKESFRLKGFTDLQASQAYAKGIPINQKQIFWDYDPAGGNQPVMSKINPYRYDGEMIRFPMIDNTAGHFQSGIVGKIKLSKRGEIVGDLPETSMLVVKEEKDKVVSKAENVNIFFLIEGTDYTAPYKDQIINAMGEIHNQNFGKVNVNYGALVYRDIPEEKGNGITEHISLTPQFESVKTFIENASFRNQFDRDEYATLYYGLQRGLRVGGFDKNKLNVIILIGSNGDIKACKSCSAEAKSSNRPELITDTRWLIEELNSIEAHLYTIQLNNDGFRSSKSFQAISRHLILETGKHAYNTTYGSDIGRQKLAKLEQVANLSISPPKMNLNDAVTRIPLIGASTLGAMNKPLVGQFMTFDQMKEVMIKETSNSIDFAHQMKNFIQNLIDKGDNVNDALNQASPMGSGEPDGAHPLSAAVASIIYESAVEKGIEVDNLLNDKLRLFTEVYIPQKVPGARYNTVSYVLFMPETDLRDYNLTIKQCAIDAVTYDEKRESLFNVYKELVEQYTKGWNNKDITRSNLLQQMQGVMGMGLEFEDPLDHNIPDILDKRKVPDSKIDEIIKRFYEVSQGLDQILRKQEFCYSTDELNRYYWVPIDKIW